VVISLVPFSDVDRRTAGLRGVLLLATFLGLIASSPVWSNSRSYPLLPMADWFPILPAPLDHLLFGIMLLSLVAAVWRYRVAVSLFLSASVIAYCGDANRGQPWLYMYWVMLWLTLLPRPSALAGCRWALTTVYLWGGIQKLNPRFFDTVPAWFVSPAANWHLPEFTLALLRGSAASAPLVEIAIALGLWFHRSRRFALAAVLALHLFAVLFLGPLGHNYNWVVWPWNLAMIALALILFPFSKQNTDAGATLVGSWSNLRRSRLALLVLLPFALLPTLSYRGLWPSQFSFALYSESNASGNVFMTQATVDRLPATLRSFVVPFPNHEPQHQGPFLFNSAAWAYEEMHVPPAAEPRAFVSVFNTLRRYAPEPQDLRMIVGERGGRVRFYQGDQTWELQAE